MTTGRFLPHHRRGKHRKMEQDKREALLGLGPGSKRLNGIDDIFSAKETCLFLVLNMRKKNPQTGLVFLVPH